jgi:hypothetical protein
VSSKARLEVIIGPLLSTKASVKPGLIRALVRQFGSKRGVNRIGSVRGVGGESEGGLLGHRFTSLGEPEANSL